MSPKCRDGTKHSSDAHSSAQFTGEQVPSDSKWIHNLLYLNIQDPSLNEQGNRWDLLLSWWHGSRGPRYNLNISQYTFPLASGFQQLTGAKLTPVFDPLNAFPKCREQLVLPFVALPSVFCSPKCIHASVYVNVCIQAQITVMTVNIFLHAPKCSQIRLSIMCQCKAGSTFRSNTYLSNSLKKLQYNCKPVTGRVAVVTLTARYVHWHIEYDKQASDKICNTEQKFKSHPCCLCLFLSKSVQYFSPKTNIW